MKFPFRRLAGPVRNPRTHIHVGNAKPLDVLRPSSKAVVQPLKENFIETSLARHACSRVVDPAGKSIHFYPDGELDIRHPCWPANPI